MRTAHKISYLITAIIMAVLVLCIPVAKQYHPVVHKCCHNEGGEHHCDCPVCCFQLSTFSVQEDVDCEQTADIVCNVYFPHTLCGYSRNYHRSIIIRGPPIN
ncbi:MAG: hypothetical protein IKR94_05935 [Bacteroidales bacterium]|nr:hypothetical protein [Bacteroidales bacterium]